MIITIFSKTSDIFLNDSLSIEMNEYKLLFKEFSLGHRGGSVG